MFAVITIGLILLSIFVSYIAMSCFMTDIFTVVYRNLRK